MKNGLFPLNLFAFIFVWPLLAADEIATIGDRKRDREFRYETDTETLGYLEFADLDSGTVGDTLRKRIVADAPKRVSQLAPRRYVQEIA